MRCELGDFEVIFNCMALCVDFLSLSLKQHFSRQQQQRLWRVHPLLDWELEMSIFRIISCCVHLMCRAREEKFSSHCKWRWTPKNEWNFTWTISIETFYLYICRFSFYKEFQFLRFHVISTCTHFLYESVFVFRFLHIEKRPSTRS